VTPIQFERLYEDEWSELEALLNAARGRKRGNAALDGRPDGSGARLAALYRRACEQLALARARSYPAHIVDRLTRVTADAHQFIYRQSELGANRLWTMAAVDFPVAVRAHRRYVALATAAFVLPMIGLGLLVHARPELILSVVDPATAASIEEMYSPSAESVGRIREATTDWMMFGFYVRNNIGVAFQCFAGGLFGGIGSLFFLAYNGAFGGAIAGYLTERGMGATFYSFVVTHAAFELTAIVLAGAAGLRLGHALLAPNRLTRAESLIRATRETAILLYGLTALLLVAAVVEAFWSSATWLPAPVKYGVAAVCWAAVIGYFTLQGRRAG
jgi:uncharacterized membrane protein SpoIIM required for sporulation